MNRNSEDRNSTPEMMVPMPQAEGNTVSQASAATGSAAPSLAGSHSDASLSPVDTGLNGNDDDDDTKASSVGDDAASQQQQPPVSLDVQLEHQRKRRRVIQRDMARLAKKFDEIKERMFTNKDFALDHERRMLMQGTHKGLLKQLDDMLAAHNRRVEVAKSRLEMMRTAASARHTADYRVARNHYLANRHMIRHVFLRALHEQRLQATHELEAAKLAKLQAKQHLFEYPVDAEEKAGHLPATISSLRSAEIETDLMIMRSARCN